MRVLLNVIVVRLLMDIYYVINMIVVKHVKMLLMIQKHMLFPPHVNR
jgi:hypothetical protein